jgi:hypothetical protein
MYVYNLRSADRLFEMFENFLNEFRFFVSVMQSYDIASLQNLVSNTISFLSYESKTKRIKEFMIVFELEPKFFRYLRFVYSDIFERGDFFIKFVSKYIERNKNNYLIQYNLTSGKIERGEIDSVEDIFSRLDFNPFEDDMLVSKYIMHKLFTYMKEIEHHYVHLLNVRYSNLGKWFIDLDRMKNLFKSFGVEYDGITCNYEKLPAPVLFQFENRNFTAYYALNINATFSPS